MLVTLSLVTLSLKTFWIRKKKKQLLGNGNRLLQNLSKTFPFLLAGVLVIQFRRKHKQSLITQQDLHLIPLILDMMQIKSLFSNTEWYKKFWK